MPYRSSKQHKPGAPFGVATKRFAKIGFHPNLDISGAMKKEITKVGPGSYNPKYPQHARGTCWKTKIDTEEFSKYLGYRNAHILQERAYYKSLRGPGTNDVNEAFYKKESLSVKSDAGFGTSNRFKRVDKSTLPPPNTYFRKLENTSSVIKHQFTKLSTFEWDGFIDRFKSEEPTYTIPVNRYNVKDGKGFNTILEKVVSLRGPYDLFTGPRDGTTIKNHFAPSTLKVPEYSYVKPSDIDIMLHHPSKQRYGLFLKAPRIPKRPSIRCMLNDISLCYRNPDDPGPAHYRVSQIKSITKKPETLYPFDKSQMNIRPSVFWTIFPGPGRYNPKPVKCMKLKRHSWVFLSKAERKIFTAEDFTCY